MVKKVKGAAEISAELQFKKYKKQLISKLGNKALYDDTIDSIGKQLFKGRWNGVHPQDKVVLKPGYQIINVDTSRQGGSHWISLYQTNNTCYIYDSYGRPSSKLLKILVKKLSQKNIKFVDSDPDAEQRNSEICGILSISFLMVAKDLGIRKALLI